MSKHTPGPWNRGITLNTRQTRQWSQKEIEANNKTEQSLIFANFTSLDEGIGRSLICTVDRINPDYQANARLIAAAPELLEALKAVWNSDPELSLAVQEQVKQAIAKATGDK